ncbi:hypothetical protein GCM10009664_36180 [Kitasatospora gansuensis]
MDHSALASSTTTGRASSGIGHGATDPTRLDRFALQMGVAPRLGPRGRVARGPRAWPVTYIQIQMPLSRLVAACAGVAMSSRPIVRAMPRASFFTLLFFPFRDDLRSADLSD